MAEVILFKPATATRKRLKIFGFGDYGTGKTQFALSFPRPIAYCDSEKGLDILDDTQLKDVDKLQTTKFEKLVEAVRMLQVNKRGYETFVCDSFTVFYQDLQNLILDRANARNTRIGKADAIRDGLTQDLWGPIKRLWKRTMSDLIDLNMNVVLLARESRKLEATPDGGFKDIGVTAEIEKSTPFIADFTLRFTFVPPPKGPDQKKTKGKHIIIIDKSRRPELPKYSEIDITGKNGYQTVFGKIAAIVGHESLPAPDKSSDIDTSETTPLGTPIPVIPPTPGGQKEQSVSVSDIPTEESVEDAGKAKVEKILEKFGAGKTEAAFDESDNGLGYLGKLKEEDLKRLFISAGKVKWPDGTPFESKDVKATIYRRYNVQSSKSLDMGQFEEFIDKLGLVAAGRLILKRDDSGVPYFAKPAATSPVSK